MVESIAWSEKLGSKLVNRIRDAGYEISPQHIWFKNIDSTLARAKERVS